MLPGKGATNIDNANCLDEFSPRRTCKTGRYKVAKRLVQVLKEILPFDSRNISYAYSLHIQDKINGGGVLRLDINALYIFEYIEGLFILTVYVIPYNNPLL